jgi:hypothetical protein
MHTVLALTGAQWGTAQDLTFGIPIGAFGAVVILALFWARSGHERAHRLRVLGRDFRREHERRRPQELEDLEPPPQTGENLPR